MNGMDDSWNISAAMIDTFIQSVYEEYTLTLIQINSVALVFYAALFKLPEEVEHIWFKPFSLLTLLYIFARYAVLAWVGLGFFIHFMSPGRSCNMVANAGNYMSILSYIGVQAISGLLIARAYSLCKGAKILAIASASCFLAQLAVILYVSITFPGCVTRSAFQAACFVPSGLKDTYLNFHSSSSAEKNIILLVQNIVSIITDIIIFGIRIWKVWGTWKLKRQAGIRSSHSLVSLVLKQSVLRCCYVVILSTTHAIFFAIDAHSSIPFIEEDLGFLLNALSSILVADFTLDLRRLNSAKITASNISLPTLQFSNVLQYAHQSILVEMSTDEEEEEGGDHGHDHDDILESTNDMDIRPVQE